jgi:hydroxyacylglutathione hydrolase
MMSSVIRPEPKGADMSTWFDLDPVLPDVWRLNDGDLDTCYVLRGSERTGVIDTGMGIGDVAAQVARVSSAPPLVINTHVHPDHVSGNYQFEEAAIGAIEWECAQAWLRAMPTPTATEGDGPSPLDLMRPKRALPAEFDPKTYRPYRMHEPTRLLHEGDTIHLGGFDLEVIVVPAHTRGSICLLDRQRRTLFTGDTVLRGTVWLHLDQSAPPHTAVATYAKLAALAADVDHVLPAHGTAVLPGSFLQALAEGTAAVAEGRIAGAPMSTFAGDGTYYDLGGYGLLFAQPVEEW